MSKENILPVGSKVEVLNGEHSYQWEWEYHNDFNRAVGSNKRQWAASHINDARGIATVIGSAPHPTFKEPRIYCIELDGKHYITGIDPEKDYIKHRPDLETLFKVGDVIPFSDDNFKPSQALRRCNKKFNEPGFTPHDLLSEKSHHNHVKEICMFDGQLCYALDWITCENDNNWMVPVSEVDEYYKNMNTKTNKFAVLCGTDEAIQLFKDYRFECNGLRLGGNIDQYYHFINDRAADIEFNNDLTRREPVEGYKVLTVAEYRAYLESLTATSVTPKLPERWAVKGGDALVEFLNNTPEGRTIKGMIYGNSEEEYYLFNGSEVYNCQKTLPSGYTEVTIEQVKNHYMNNTNRKIIGYRSPVECYNQPAGTVFVKAKEHFYWYYPQGGNTNQSIPKQIAETWDPVYEKERLKLPTINGYDGEIQGKRIKYGCQVFMISDFKQLHYVMGKFDMRFVEVSRQYTLTKDDADQIMAYLNENDL